MDKNSVQMVLRSVEYDGFKFEILAIGDPGDMNLIMRVHDFEWDTIYECKEDSDHYKLFSAIGEAVQNAIDGLRASQNAGYIMDESAYEMELAGLIRAVKAIVR